MDRPAQTQARGEAQDQITEAIGVASFIYRRQQIIEWGHCDPAGIVFNPRFFEYFDAGTWLLFETVLGLKTHEFAATFGIIGTPVVDARANFLKPVRFGDVVEIASRVSEFRRSSFDVEHKITINGALAVEGQETRGWAIRDKSNADKISAVAIPSEVIAKFG